MDDMRQKYINTYYDKIEKVMAPQSRGGQKL
jgi:hypothetical protein